MSYRNSGRYGGRSSDGAPHRSSGSYQPLIRRSTGGGGGSWHSGQAPSRNSWGGSSHHGSGMMSSGGRGHSLMQSDTLSAAASLVSALLHNQRPSYPSPARAEYGSRSFSAGASFRSRSDSFRRAPVSSRYDSTGNKFSGRRDFSGGQRGRTSNRGSRDSHRTGSRTVDKSKSKDKENVSKTKTKESGETEEKTKDVDGVEVDADEEEAQVVTESGDETKAEEDGHGEKKEKKREREEISSDYLNCHLCDVQKMSDVPAFMNHMRGHKHRRMVQLTEERLRHQASLIRVEIQMSNHRETEHRSSGGDGRKGHKRYSYCSMCEVRVPDTELTTHRSTNPLHIKLKNFLHPRCCGIRFDTPVRHEMHLLSMSHFRRMQQRDREIAEAGTGAKPVGIPPPRPKKEEPAPAEDGDATEQDSAMEDAATEEASGEQSDSVVKQEPSGDNNQTVGDEAENVVDADQSQLQEEEVKKEVEEEIPAMYDDCVILGSGCGQQFDAMFCPACYIALPVANWEEHCRSHMHFNRYTSMLRSARRERERQERIKQEARGVKREAEDDGQGAATKKPADGDGDSVIELSENGAHMDDEVNALEVHDEEMEPSENGTAHVEDDEVTVEADDDLQTVDDDADPPETNNTQSEDVADVPETKDDDPDLEEVVPVETEAELEVPVEQKSPTKATRASRGGVARRSRARARRT